MGRVFFLWVMMALSLACQGRDDLDGRRRPIPGLGDRGAVYDLGVEDSRVVVDLLDNRAAFVVHDAGALTIECGTADFVKYVDGGYRTPWHFGADDAGRRAALVHGLAGELYVPLGNDAGGVERERDGSIIISLLARAARPKQLVSVFLNEKRLGDIAMPGTDWRTYSIRAPAATVVDGENKLRFYFRHTGEIDGKHTAAAIQRIRVGKAGAQDAPVLRADSVSRGNKRLGALRVTQAARLSYYVRVPRGQPSLLFALGGQGADVAVHVAGVGSAASRVWQGVAGEEWTTTRVDLSPWAGEVARIDLVSQGAVDWGQPQIVVPEAGPAEPLIKRPPRPADHVVIWVVSALRADRVGDKVPTPAFGRLAEHGVRFARAHTAAPVPAAAHVGLLSGRHPQASVLGDGVTTLGERFGEAGFTTALISGNGFVNDEAGFAQGFALYRNPMRLRHPFRARVLWQRARRLLQTHKDSRTFIYLVTVEPHLPYDPSPESLAAEWDRGSMRFTPGQTLAVREALAAGKERLSREEQAYVQALYNAEVRDADAAFGEMLADLDELGVADRTAVILVADHGEELWERDSFGNGQSLYQEVVQVPLVIRAPGQAGLGPVVVDQDVSLVDVYATALDLAGISAGPETQGMSLLALDRDAPLPRPIFSHLPGHGRSLKLDRYKLVVRLRGAPQLFDLAADPGERHDRMGTLPMIERYMRNVFGIGVAYQSAWSRSRWGAANNMGPAFAADHGL